jgi:hypothetical protein
MNIDANKYDNDYFDSESLHKAMQERAGTWVINNFYRISILYNNVSKLNSVIIFLYILYIYIILITLNVIC